MRVPDEDIEVAIAEHSPRENGSCADGCGPWPCWGYYVFTELRDLRRTAKHVEDFLDDLDLSAIPDDWSETQQAAFHMLRGELRGGRNAE